MGISLNPLLEIEENSKKWLNLVWNSLTKFKLLPFGSFCLYILVGATIFCLSHYSLKSVASSEPHFEFLLPDTILVIANATSNEQYNQTEQYVVYPATIALVDKTGRAYCYFDICDFNILNPKIFVGEEPKAFGIQSDSVDIVKRTKKDYLKNFGFDTFNLNFGFNVKEIIKDIKTNKTIYIGQKEHNILGSSPLERYWMDAKLDGTFIIITANR